MKNQLITYISFWLGQISFFIFNFIASKYLEQTDYSIFIILLAIIMFGMRFIEVGIGDYFIIDGSKKDLQTIYIINIVKGILICLVFLLLHNKIILYFDNKIDRKYIVFVAFIFVIEPLKNPNIYRYYKHKKLVPVAIIERLSYAISIIIGIVLMLIYKQLWVLIVTYYIFFLLQLILSYTIIPPFKISRPFFVKIYMKKVIRFTSHIIGFIILSYMIRQGLDLIIPKYIGFDNFAIYSFTMLIGIVPTNFLIYPLNKILFPIYTSLSLKNKKELPIVFHSVFSQTFIILIVIALIIYFISPILLELLNHTKLFDYQFLKIILIYSVIRGITALLGTIYKSLNKQKLYNKVLLIEAIFLFFLLFSFNTNMFLIIYVLIAAMMIHLIFGLLFLKKHIKFDNKKIISFILIGLLYAISQISLEYFFNITYLLIAFNSLFFVSLLYKFLLSLKKHFI